MTTTKPWLKLYQGMPADIDLPDLTMYELLADTARRYPDQLALYYLGRKLKLSKLIAEIDACAAGFTAYGIKAGDSVLLSLPNIPGAVVCFYALNKIGARAVMTHPLSSAAELKHYITLSQSRWVVTVDIFYPVFHELAAETGLEKLLITRISDYMKLTMRLAFMATRGRQIPPLPDDDPLVLTWADFMAAAEEVQPGPYTRAIDPDDTAAVLFSGGTTNLPKGIELTSANFNALSVAINAIANIEVGDSVLAILPVFHGFGLGLCIHTALCSGGQSILVPEFSAETYIDYLIKFQPSHIAGVPTLFQALMMNPRFSKVRFDRLKGAYSGGDLLSPDLKQRFDDVIMAQGSRVELTEGYGLTECVTACAISPPGHYRHGSMGIPMPNIDVMVADPTTGQELPYGTEGEICINGPTVMKGYLADAEATDFTLRTHDGQTWLHTGDIGTMDADGYMYFMGRIKRIIKVSGVSVYPMQIEMVLESHPAVDRACVIGLPDDYQMSSVKAFVTLADGSLGDDQVRAELIAYCKKNLFKWAVPRQIEFRDKLPTTRVGKIAYTDLEREELAKLARS